MSAPVKMPKRVLSQSEVEFHRDRIGTMKEELRPVPDGSGLYRPQDEGVDEAQRRTIRKSERILRAGDPKQFDLSRVDRGRLEDKRRELVAWLSKRMVPRSHIDQRANGDPEFRKAVNEVAKSEMSQEFGKVAQEFKKISRLLFPDDPSMSNLETIRPANR